MSTKFEGWSEYVIRKSHSVISDSYEGALAKVRELASEGRLKAWGRGSPEGEADVKLTGMKYGVSPKSKKEEREAVKSCCGKCGGHSERD